ncbi:MAG: hypothetical protein L0Y58_08410 [Verrucomicrobia subdivision 3 bacterium]|nr:hypothetical protein [Limisphaerales bacterium]
MRKRIVIAVIAVVAIGIAALLVSELPGPKRGTVEWHKKEFENGRRLTWIGTIVRRCPARLRHSYVESRYKRWLFHRQALIDVGYFEEKAFIVSNRPPHEVANALWLTRHEWSTNSLVGIPSIRVDRSNSVMIVALPNQMRRLEELVRQADVAENRE